MSTVLVSRGVEVPTGRDIPSRSAAFCFVKWHVKKFASSRLSLFHFSFLMTGYHKIERSSLYDAQPSIWEQNKPFECSGPNDCDRYSGRRSILRIFVCNIRIPIAVLENNYHKRVCSLVSLFLRSVFTISHIEHLHDRIVQTFLSRRAMTTMDCSCAWHSSVSTNHRTRSELSNAYCSRGFP